MTQVANTLGFSLSYLLILNFLRLVQSKLSEGRIRECLCVRAPRGSWGLDMAPWSGLEVLVDQDSG